MVETAARGAQFLIAIGIAYLIAVWFALVAWTFRDIESRSRSVFTQVFSTLLVVLFFVPGLLLYLILRPKETLDQAFQRALEEEYLLQDLDELPLCPGCQRSVDPEFVLCPHCQTSLRSPCPACSRLVDLRWDVCPYCAVPVDKAALEVPLAGPETLRILEDARVGRRKRAVNAAAQRVGIEPEELDAFTDALSGSGGRPAVGAGIGASAVTRRIASFGESARVRSGMRARVGNEDDSSVGSVQDQRLTSPAETSPPGPRGAENGFWSDPLPSPPRARGDSVD
ncbi:MAG: zinc ribbon domain-containing protein [Chloroflexi bacterium]|nr:zinc ribbon domain-containing protein [Chloroflexota bacterium]